MRLLFLIFFLSMVGYFTYRDLGTRKAIKILSRLIKDPSAWSLFISNLIIIWFFSLGQLTFPEIFFIYWGQGVIIVLISILTVLLTQKYSMHDVSINRKPVPTTWRGKVTITLVATSFYAIFFGLYLGFISSLDLSLGESLWQNTKIPLIIFGIDHLFSALYNSKLRGDSPTNIGQELARPFNRIAPMHLIILFGQFFGGMYNGIIFLYLKTGADLLSHEKRHASPIIKN